MMMMVVGVRVDGCCAVARLRKYIRVVGVCGGFYGCNEDVLRH